VKISGVAFVFFEGLRGGCQEYDREFTWMMKGSECGNKTFGFEVN